MSVYVHITKDQQTRANAVDLEMLLRSKGEPLKRSGPEYLWTRHKGVTIRGNQWYSHYNRRGGCAIDFMREFYGMSYPDAVMHLLGNELPIAEPAAKADSKDRKKKEFTLPEANGDMRRVFAYLMKTRFIAREAIEHFAHEKLLYEDAVYHNAIFVGRDEYGIPRHAHKKGTWPEGGSFQANMEGSDPRYSFHHVGEGDTLHVFESPIDMLSYITLHPAGWKLDSYVALDGVSEHAMIWMLEQYPDLTKVVLHLDSDPAGIEADFRLGEILREHGRLNISIEKSRYKDCNEDIKAENGITPRPAMPHPKLALLLELAERQLEACADTNPSKVGFEDISTDCNMLRILTSNTSFVGPRNYDRENELLDSMLTKTIFFISNELRQMECPKSHEEIIAFFVQSYAPHKDRDHMRSKLACVNRDIIELGRMHFASGIRTKADRDNCVAAAFRLAQDCLRARIGLELALPSQEQLPEMKLAQ